MTEPGDAVDVEPFDIGDGPLSVAVDPEGEGKATLAVRYGGDVIESGKYRTPAVFRDRTERGRLLNRAEEGAEDRPDADAGGVRGALKEWLAEMSEQYEEVEDEFLPEEVNAIREGTLHPVEVYRGEPTTWRVTLTFRGETRELEFTTSEMLNDSGGALEEKIANHFLEFLEIGSEDWQAIRDDWVENKTVVDTGDETTADAIADRVLELLGERATPVDEREKLGNDPKAVWFDETNAAAYENAPPDASIAWVQDSHIVDELERAGKSIDYKSQLLKTLIARGDLYGKRARRRWYNQQRGKFYPFRPDALGITADDVGGDEPAHSEVDA
jgi:hypothetical protein